MIGRSLAVVAALILFAASEQEAVAHPHNSLEIIEAPVPQFPSELELPGRCEVRFRVHDYTKIRIETVLCSQLILCDPARTAVEAASVRVVDNSGEEGVGNTTNQLYPLEFAFGEPDEPSEAQLRWIDRLPLISCSHELFF